jgi:hypothetical protein
MLHTFDTQDLLLRDPNQDNLYNLFEKTIENNIQDLDIYFKVVEREEEMRLDLFCKNIYNSKAYLEELMLINNIFNIFSIKQGDEIAYLNEEDMKNLQKQDTNTEDTIAKLVDKVKNTKIDPNRTNNVYLPPVIKPDNLKQVDVNHKEKTIRVINSFE